MESGTQHSASKTAADRSACRLPARGCREHRPGAQRFGAPFESASQYCRQTWKRGRIDRGFFNQGIGWNDSAFSSSFRFDIPGPGNAALGWNSAVFMPSCGSIPSSAAAAGLLGRTGTGSAPRFIKWTCRLIDRCVPPDAVDRHDSLGHAH